MGGQSSLEDQRDRQNMAPGRVERPQVWKFPSGQACCGLQTPGASES